MPADVSRQCVATSPSCTMAVHPAIPAKHAWFQAQHRWLSFGACETPCVFCRGCFWFAGIALSCTDHAF